MGSAGEAHVVIHRFGPFELDERVYELRRGGADLQLRRRSFDVLRVLIDERDRVVAKEELLDRVWGRRFVSQSALANCVSELRAAFGREGEARAIIRTVYGRGYRFVAELASAAPAAGADTLWCRLIDEALAGIGDAQPTTRAGLLIAQAIARLAVDPAGRDEGPLRDAIALAEAHACPPLARLAHDLLGSLA